MIRFNYGLNSVAVEFQRQLWLEEDEVKANSHVPPVDYRFNPKGFSLMRDLISYFDKRMFRILSGDIEDETGAILYKTAQNLNNALVIFARYATALDAPESVRQFVRLAAPEYVRMFRQLNRSCKLHPKVNTTELKGLVNFLNAFDSLHSGSQERAEVEE